MLAKSGVQINERLYFKEKATVEEVRALAALLPGGPSDILSTRSRKYQELALSEQKLEQSELIALLVAEPGLWRRPIVVLGNTAVVGFNEKNLEALIS